jgi:hypothetical protein
MTKAIEAAEAAFGEAATEAAESGARAVAQEYERRIKLARGDIVEARGFLEDLPISSASLGAIEALARAVRVC